MGMVVTDGDEGFFARHLEIKNDKICSTLVLYGEAAANSEKKYLLSHFFSEENESK